MNEGDMGMASSLKIAKDYFKANNNVRVVFHWRWDKLSPSSREVMGSYRMVKVLGHRAVFNEGVSEMDLRGMDYATSEGGRCLLVYANGAPMMTYEVA
jgi:hypothetical protein